MDIGLGAGVIKSAAHLTDDLLKCPAAFLIFGSDTLLELEGNKEPTYYFDEATGTSYNAIGLKNKGAAAHSQEIPAISKRVWAAGKRFRKSLAPTGPGHLRQMLRTLAIAPLRTLVDQYEFNAACPNHRVGEHLHSVLSRDKQALRELLEETREAALAKDQKALKIAPDTDDEMLHTTVDLCVEYGIGTLVSSNTFRVPTPVVNGKPVISVEFCGMGGTPLLEKGLKQMARLAKIREQAKAPIKLSYCGGISQGKHARRAEEAGADEIQIVTAHLRYGAKIFQDVLLTM